MKNLLPLFVCLFLFVHPCFSQEKFERAIVITLRHDTLHGYVDNQDWLTNPTSIVFKKTLADTVFVFTAAELLSFRFDSSDAYVARSVNMHYYCVNVKEIEELKDTIIIRQTAFLRVLVQGAASLYVYIDEHRLSHFFIEKNGAPTDELVLLEQLAIDQYGKKYVQTIQKYRNSLSYYMNDCPKVVDKLSSLEFNDKALQKIFVEYNKCVSSGTPEFIGKTDRVKFVPGLLAGVFNTSIKFRTSDVGFDELSESVFPSFTGLAGGLFADILFPRNHYRLALCNDFLYRNYETEANIQAKVNAGVANTTDKYKFEFSYIRIATLLGFDLSNSMIRPFVKAGIGNSFATRHQVIYSSFGSTREYTVLERKYEQSLIICAGVKWQNYRFDCRWESGNGSSSIGGLKMLTNTFSALFGCSF